MSNDAQRKKATMTLNLSQAEMDALDKMATAKELSKTATIRQALRTLQYVDAQLREGRELAFIGKDGQLIRTIVVGCGGE